MQFHNLLRAKVGEEIIYFDGDGMLYEKHPISSHYALTGKFVYYEYYEKPLLMLEPCMAVLGASEYDVEYAIADDEQQNQQKKGEKHNGSK